MNKLWLNAAPVAVALLLQACLHPESFFTEAESNTKSTPAASSAATPLYLVLDGKREIDVSDFNYVRQYADSGYLISDNGSVREVYHIEFSGEDSGTYVYQARLVDGSIVGKGSGTFHFKYTR